jgi:hypothetical protein
MANALRWVEYVGTKRVCVNHGNSKRTQFCRKRKKRIILESADGCKPIKNCFFPQIPVVNEIDTTVVPLKEVQHLRVFKFPRNGWKSVRDIKSHDEIGC